MLLTLEITRQAPSVYLARTLAANVEVTEPSTYTNIEEAIFEEARAIPDGFAHFLEVRYSGFSSGTELVEEVPGKAHAITARFMELASLTHRLQEAGSK